VAGVPPLARPTLARHDLQMFPAVVCALAVAALLAAEHRRSASGVAVAKPVASAAFLWAGASAGALATPYGQFVLGGLVLCALGDVLLIPTDRPRVFRAGILAFLLGHVAYVGAFLHWALSGTGLAVAGVALGALVWRVHHWLAPHLKDDMRGAVRAYLVVITVMAVIACAATWAGAPLAIAAGAVGFLLSDIAVARDRFVRPEFVNRAWGLPLYYGSQLLLAYSVAAPVAG
jgi:uncharacterized membrane protein YhhN